MEHEFSKKFEEIDRETSRLKVPQGWIVRTIAITSEGVGVHTFFMSDVLNIWKLKGE